MILALDLGTRTGVAWGSATAGFASSHARVLKAPDAPREAAYAALLGFLDETFQVERPELLVKEAPPQAAAFATMGNAGATVRMTLGLHACVEAMSVRYRVSWREVAPATVRKHFLGSANRGSRTATKAAVLQRCHLLGYLDRDCRDEDRADACAILDWSLGQLRSPSTLHLFGEAPAPIVSIGNAANAVVRKVRRRRAAA